MQSWILQTHTHTHTLTLPDKGKTNLVRTRAIGLSPLKGDFLADPLQASLLKQDRKFPGKTLSPSKELTHCHPCENTAVPALMDVEVPFGACAPIPFSHITSDLCALLINATRTRIIRRGTWVCVNSQNNELIQQHDSILILSLAERTIKKKSLPSYFFLL